MTTFAGFDDWVEIFRGGTQTDSSGKEHDGDGLINRAVQTFNAAEHEPPAVIGHPKDDSPAWAWVQDLKAEVVNGAKVLMARFKDAVPEFVEMVRDGRFKKRSAAFYPDGRLRHVGFLGAAPPAVKGLANLKFSSQDSIFLETEEGDKPMADESKKFTEAEIELAKKAAADQAREDERAKLKAEFAEQQRRTEQEAVKTANRGWLEAKVADGTIPPGIAKAGIAEFMDSLDSEAEFRFAEGAGKQTGAAWFRGFLGDLFEGKFTGLFTELATKQAAKKDGEDGFKIPANITSKV